MPAVVAPAYYPPLKSVQGRAVCTLSSSWLTSPRLLLSAAYIRLISPHTHHVAPRVDTIPREGSRETQRRRGQDARVSSRVEQGEKRCPDQQGPSVSSSAEAGPGRPFGVAGEAGLCSGGHEPQLTPSVLTSIPATLTENVTPGAQAADILHTFRADASHLLVGTRNNGRPR